jgi:hypothetical protein
MNMYFRNLKKALLAGCLGEPVEYTYDDYDANSVFTEYYIGSSSIPKVPLSLNGKKLKIVGPTTFCGKDITGVDIKQKWSMVDGDWTVDGPEQVM